MNRTLSACVAALISCVVVAPVAAAQDIDETILAYNDAVTGGDAQAKVAAAGDLGEAVLAHPERDDAARLAYEAGQTLCLYSDCKGAAPLAAFALNQPEADGPIGTTDFTLLKTYTDWRRNPDHDSRQELDEALAAKVDSDLTYLSLTAFHNRYAEDAISHHWKRASESAAEAARHFAPYRSIVGDQWSDARIVAITSSFNYDPDTEDVLDMVRHVSALKKYSASFDSNRPDWIKEQYYLADAWQMAMSAYFHSNQGTRLGTHLRGPDPKDLDARISDIEDETEGLACGIPPADNRYSPDEESSLPFCDGNFNMSPRLRYPSRAARKGMFGAVILKVGVEDLNVANVEVLAAVPNEGFSDDLVDTVKKWRWEVEEGVPGETCRTSRSNIIWPFVYQIDP